MKCLVALIGPDGSGKTTIARRIVAGYPEPLRYLYMGTATESANVSLPTTRWLWRMKQRSHRRTHGGAGATVATHELESHKVERGRMVRLIGVTSRIAEEWYRQLVSWMWRARGFVVLCDRHFVFEYVPDSTEAAERIRQRPLSVRLHMWIIRRLYPRPSLTLYLDAPVDVLLGRKIEWDREHLERHRNGILEQGARIRNFVRVDATRSIDEVAADVQRRILEFSAGNR